MLCKKGKHGFCYLWRNSSSSCMVQINHFHLSLSSVNYFLLLDYYIANQKVTNRKKLSNGNFSLWFLQHISTLFLFIFKFATTNFLTISLNTYKKPFFHDKNIVIFADLHETNFMLYCRCFQKGYRKFKMNKVDPLSLGFSPI